MKKISNVFAFILIVGLVGSWECDTLEFGGLLFSVGTVLSVLMIFHIAVTVFCIVVNNKKIKRKIIKERLV